MKPAVSVGLRRHFGESARPGAVLKCPFCPQGEIKIAADDSAARCTTNRCLRLGKIERTASQERAAEDRILRLIWEYARHYNLDPAEEILAMALAKRQFKRGDLRAVSRGLLQMDTGMSRESVKRHLPFLLERRPRVRKPQRSLTDRGHGKEKKPGAVKRGEVKPYKEVDVEAPPLFEVEAILGRRRLFLGHPEEHFYYKVSKAALEPFLYLVDGLPERPVVRQQPKDHVQRPLHELSMLKSPDDAQPPANPPAVAQVKPRRSSR